MDSITGKIHSIETFGTVDGPGIRYVVFLQGCPLRCRFCHNRDTWELQKGKDKTAKEIVEDALKYRAFIDASKGGITLSGGEATMQPLFAEEVFRLAKEAGLHTCLDTSGFIAVDKVKNLLRYTDLVLLDLKHMDEKRAAWLTGQSSRPAMELALYLDSVRLPFWLRHVLIPGITDSEEHLREMAAFASSLHYMERFEFLPYHTMGVHKWEEVGDPYTLPETRAAEEEDILRAKEIFKSCGISI